MVATESKRNLDPDVQKRLIDYILPFINQKMDIKGRFITIQPKRLNPAHVSIEKMVKDKITIHQRMFSDLKPEGIWGSGKFNLRDLEYTWLNFSYQEAMYHWIDPTKNDFYTFELKKSAKIYVIESNRKSLDRFIKKYRYQPIENDGKISGIQTKLKKESHRLATKKEMIDKIMANLISWERLQKDGYDGIYFPHYRKFAHFDKLPYWFSTIDVTSICIWNPEAINGLKKIPLDRRVEAFLKLSSSS